MFSASAEFYDLIYATRMSASTKCPDGCLRTSRVEIEGRISRLLFDYEIADGAGRRSAREVHELGLFTLDELTASFEAAGLAAEYDPEGLTGRGLCVARPA